MMPLVSVIIPNYNHAKYLRQRIESVFNQSFQDFEVITMDDASTDDSLAVIEEYRSHPKVAGILLNKTNTHNLLTQWRKGVNESRGEYIWIAESDDYADREFLEQQVALMDGQEQCAIAFSNSYIVNGNGEITDSTDNWTNKTFATSRWSGSYYNEGKDELFKYVLIACTLTNISACIFRKSAFRNAIENIVDISLISDWIVYMKLLYKHDILYNPRKLNYYRMHSGNSSKRNLKGAGEKSDRFLVKLNFLRSFPFTDEEYERIIKELGREYRGILGALRSRTISIKNLWRTHKNIKNGKLYMRIITSSIRSKYSNPNKKLSF